MFSYLFQTRVPIKRVRMRVRVSVLDLNTGSGTSVRARVPVSHLYTSLGPLFQAPTGRNTFFCTVIPAGYLFHTSILIWYLITVSNSDLICFCTFIGTQVPGFRHSSLSTCLLARVPFSGFSSRAGTSFSIRAWPHTHHLIWPAGAYFHVPVGLVL